MSSATITSKGQVTIPSEVRASLGLHSGDRLSFRVRDDGVVEIRPETIDLLTLFGALRPRKHGVTVEAMNETIRQHWARR